MAGRPAKPIDLLLMQGGKHLTNEEIETRKKQEESLKSNAKYKPNSKVKTNPAAMKMFRKLEKLYKNIDYVDGLDENIINRYCLLTSEVDSMEKLLDKMEGDIDKCEEPGQMVSLYKAISGMEGNLNRARDMLLKIEDRMFLNPTARLKNVPHKPKEDESESKWGAYKAGGGSG